MWSCATGAVETRLEGPGAGLVYVDFADADRVLAAGGRRVVVFDRVTERPLRTIDVGARITHCTQTAG